MLRLMPLTNVDNWTYQSGFTSFCQTPIAVVTCGLMTSMRNCARTYISFDKLRLAMPKASVAFWLKPMWLKLSVIIC